MAKIRGSGVDVVKATLGGASGSFEEAVKAIAKMNEIGVALDLSHSNTQTTAAGIAASRSRRLFRTRDVAPCICIRGIRKIVR
jgi:hypothetical protein